MQFDLKVYHPTEGVVRFRCVAVDEPGARRKAAEHGYSVLSLHAKRFRRPHGRKFRVALFAQELLALIQAGMSLIEAMTILSTRARDLDTRNVLQGLLLNLCEGQTLSSAMTREPNTFPTLVVATIKASEQTGNLREALERYLAYHRQLNAVRDKVISASIYPALLLGVGGLAIMFLLSYVVPRFGRVYADLGQQDIPVMSRLLIDLGTMFSEHGAAVFAGSLATVGAISYALTRPALHAAVHAWLWRLPHLGQQLHTYQLARFTRTVAMLIKGGVPLVPALDMTAVLLQQHALRAGLLAARNAIYDGGALAEAFASNGLATDIGVRLLVVGERSGNLGDIMEKIAAFYDEEIAREVEWFSKSFEPLLMTVIGCLIGGIVILMYLPIFDLASNIK